MSKKLSILICSLQNRSVIIKTLLDVLLPQLNNDVEVLINSDGGERSTGKKRNELLDIATGDYIVFIDDDDVVSTNYVSLILEAIKTDPDVIGMHLLMTTRGRNECRTYHSLKYRTWYDEPDPDRKGLKRYFRNPNHLNPVKREHAVATRFPEKNVGEDHDYSTRLLPLLNTEVYIEKPIYHYLAGRV